MTTPRALPDRRTPSFGAYTPGASARPPASDRVPSGDGVWPARLVSLGYAGVCVLALLACVTSLWNGFAYDDVVVIAKNARVHSLQQWWHVFQEAYWPPPFSGGLYRPLVILMWQLLWKLGGGSPLPFHAANVVLYVATCAATYRLARYLLPERAAWLAAALFAVHPVHVEAVGNVVGVAEVMTALASLLAVCTYIEARRRGGKLSYGDMLRLGLLYAAACLSKEHGLFLPALLAVAELFAIDDPRPPLQRLRAIVPLALLLAVVGGAWLAARNSVPDVVSGARYSAVLGLYPWKVRLFTFFMVVREWVRLFFWPAHLSSDYAPQQIMIPLRWTWGQLPGVLVALFVAFGSLLVMRVNRRAAFAVGWVAVTLAIPSGLVVAIGVLLAERTLFMPSVGVMFLVGFAAHWLWTQSAREPRVGRSVRVALVAASVALLAAGAWRSADRQRVWKDNDSVFSNEVIDAPLSFRAHYSYGGHLMDKGDFREGERHLRMSIALFDADPEPRELLGMKYYFNDFCAPAIPLLQEAMDIRRNFSIYLVERSRQPRAALVKCYIAEKQYDLAALAARRSLEMDRTDTLAAGLVRTADSALSAANASGRPWK